MAQTETRIVVVVLGGNISQVKDGSDTRSLEDVQDFVRQSDKFLKSVTITRFVDISKGDSINRTPAHWQELCLTLNDVQKACDGILVLDGIDALAFDGAATTDALARNLRTSIIFVGDHDGINKGGEFMVYNGLLALQTAHQQQVREVMTVDDKTLHASIIRASRATKIRNFGYPIFSSPIPRGILANYRQLGFGPNSRYASEKEKFIDKIPAEFDDRIGFVNAVPGGYNHRRLLDEIRAGEYLALIIQSTEAGRIPTDLQDVIDGQHIQKRPVLIQTEHVENIDTKARAIIEIQPEIQRGAISTLDMTHEAVWVKTAWLLAQEQYRDSVETFKAGFYQDFGDITV